MHDHIYSIDLQSLNSLTSELQKNALLACETGKVIYCPDLFFQPSFLKQPNQEENFNKSLNEDGLPAKKIIFSEDVLDKKHKNISFDYHTKKIGGLAKSYQNTPISKVLSEFIQGYAQFSKTLLNNLFPQYNNYLQWGRTSYRPAEVKNRPASKRKDDSRVHVDSFAATPVNGLRILRVFCNINPYGMPRVWDLGEPFEEVIKHFAQDIPKYNIFIAKLINILKITKTLRSAYDHYQLHLHDAMKLDDNYQANVKKISINFPAQSTWIVFTDAVSHAAHRGQFLLEQTFYLPVKAMAHPKFSPLKVWEAFTRESLCN